MVSDIEKTFMREEYTLRINRVQDYIEEHLEEEFSLPGLAQVAHFSPYHFHRIFGSLTGETLFEYIQRVRLEKAAYFLIANPNKTVTQVALSCGFSNQASFAKAFKKYWEVSATQFRQEHGPYKSKHYKIKSKIGKVSHESTCYNNTVIKKQCYLKEPFKDLAFSVEVKDIEEMHVAYIRHTGPYQEDVALFESLFSKLSKWVKEKVSESLHEIKTLILCHDNPSLTDEHKLRISLCMVVPEGIKGDGEIGTLIIAGGKYAIGHFKLAYNDYGNAWASMYSKWLPESGYQPDDRLAFEFYTHNDIKTEESGSIEYKKSVAIFIPVRPL
jgi:AraC family transcriptional regulator